MSPGAHHPRPTDLVALISFGGKVYENQAITREHLGRTTPTPHMLAAAIQQWLRRGRQTWIDVRGRHIHGVATARGVRTDAPAAWEIDTLVDGGGDGGESTVALLQQVAEAAAATGVTHVLLRMRAEALALPAALRAGFTVAAAERLWVGNVGEAGDGAPPSEAPSAEAPPVEALTVRPLDDGDLHAQFRLYNRAVPIECRQLLAMTLDEWQATRERRWLGRRPVELGAFEADELRATLSAHLTGDRAQLELLADGTAGTALTMLLRSVCEQSGHSAPLLALVPRFATTTEAALSDAGLQPADEYVLLCKRTTKTVPDRVRARAGAPIPS